MPNSGFYSQYCKSIFGCSLVQPTNDIFLLNWTQYWRDSMGVLRVVMWSDQHGGYGGRDVEGKRNLRDYWYVLEK